MADVVRVFEKGKETKNKVRYEELDGDGTEEAVGTLYVTKAALAELGTPEQVKVTISGN